MKKYGFTLAEVLITLGVIGIVASITLPALIKNYQKKVAATRVKQAYSQILQAIQLSEAENDELTLWDMSMSADRKENTELVVKKYIEPYLKSSKLCTINCGVSIGSTDIKYFLGNGTSAAFLVDYNNNDLYVMIGTNGSKGKCRLGTDCFYFSTTGAQPKRLMPYGWFEGITREDILNGYEFAVNNYRMSCKKTPHEDGKLGYRHACTVLLMFDNWEMKNDYPF